MKDYRPPKERKMNIYHPPPGAKAYDSGLKYSSKTEDMNGFEEGVEFLPTMNAKKLEKRGPKRWLLVFAIIFICLILSLLVGFLVWHFKFRNIRVVKHYNGNLRVPNLQFVDAYENSSSSEFATLAKKVKGALIEIYNSNQDVGPFHTKTGISAFSEGSVIAYYWSEFSVPKYKADALDDAMANIKSLDQILHRIRKPEIRVDSLVAFPSDPDIMTSSWDNSCRYALHAKEGVVTSFSTPGFPNSPYASNVRCLWVLRADADSVISLTFTTFDVEPCTLGNDFVKVYDSLSPVEAHSLVKLCGSFNPSYNLTFVSSQNILLVMLITDAKGRYPGFKAEFFQMPKQQKTCGGVLTGASGNFSTPYYPAHYPPSMDCVWTIKVPQDKNVKVRFQEFFLVEPGIPMGSCTKDYVEINKEKYCGLRQSFVVSSKTNEITVHFHSDLSFVDTGFWAEYLSYDSNDPCPGKFTCQTGRCVDKARRCDGWLDCVDASDEENCNCTEKQFRCHNNRCKPKYWLCDGVNDCGDNSDELQCQCPADNFKCSNGKCILLAQKCNGKDDCGDGSDEGDCGTAVTVPCQVYTYKCRNNLCVNKRNPECDGEKDCSDNSDEANCECGNRSYRKQSRIVGGQNSDVGEWPWQVSLHAKGLGHACGATLISEKWLVSAAHCFREENSIRYNDPMLWTAYMGLLDQRDRTNAFVQSRSIKSITQHPYYNDYTFDYDIALVELSSPVTFTKQIQPICLPDVTHEFPTGKAMWVTGWGATVEDGIGAMILQKAEIRMINQTMCNTLLPNQLTPRMMCVGILTGGVDACQGDSGGPLISIEANGKIFLAGVVSFGDGCARRNKPGVYTRVSKVMDWIKSKTGL